MIVLGKTAAAFVFVGHQIEPPEESLSNGPAKEPDYRPWAG